MTLRSPIALLTTVAAFTVLAGCGGAGSSSPASAGGRSAHATLRVLWPERQGRMIPNAANSLVVQLSKGGTPVDSKTIARPASGQSQTETEFTGLDVAAYDVTIKAYPTTDGNGVAQASGAGTLNAAIDGSGTVTVSLASTVSTVEVTPAAPSVAPNGSTTVTASAQDALGNLVLLAAGGGTEAVTWSSDATSVATVSGDGLSATVNGIGVGTANVKASLTVKDSGETVTGSAAVTVAVSTVPVTFNMPWTFNGVAAPAAWKSVHVYLEDTHGAKIEKTVERTGDNSQASTTLDAEPGTYLMTYQVYDAANGAGTKLQEQTAGVTITSSGPNAYTFGTSPFAAARLTLSIRSYGQIPSGGYVYSDFVSHALLTLVWSKTNGTTENVTNDAVWSVDHVAIAALQSRVSGQELVPIRSGNTVVRATLNGQTYSVNASIMYF